MSELIHHSSLPVPSPREEVHIRPGNMGDIEFIDRLQKQYSNQLGFMPMPWLIEKIKANHILIAETGGGRVGYIIAQDKYIKREDVGIVYQIAVDAVKQRGFIGTALLQAQFNRSAYGCRLYCCWCAQDIEGNRFWESMGFYPLAYRQGSQAKDRVHIFWQKKIRGKDDAINWWFPSKTDSGAMNEDRIVLPIGPGMHWRDVRPMIIPTTSGGILPEAIQGPTTPTTSTTRVKRPKFVRQPLMGGLRFAPKVVEAEVKAEPRKRAKKPKVKIDAKFVAASRELRDRYLEEVNERGFKLTSNGKYELTRQSAGAAVGKVSAMIAA